MEKSVSKVMAVKSGVAAAALLALTSGFALADGLPDAGLYLGFGAGGTIQPDHSFTSPTLNSEINSEPGWAFIPAIGWRWGNGLRTELEGGYRRNNVKEINNCPTCGDSGDQTAWTAMVNALYDFQTDGWVHPYLGVGVGGADVKFQGIGPIGGTNFDDSQWVFAYQGIAGIGITLDRPVEAFIEYRYLGTTGLDLSTATAGGNIKSDSNYQNHAFMIGARINLYSVHAPVAEPVAAKPAPAPVPRNYIVFFDFDKDVLTPTARQTVETASANAKAGGVSKIDVTGYTDRAGTPQYNLGLSKRRAERVRDAMVALGVPASQIVVAWKGESDPAVPTADGVPEPRNRRVTIIYE
jgi:outer membrane protein OmpA-like peptidoglycan-associated protein